MYIPMALSVHTIATAWTYFALLEPYRSEGRTWMQQYDPAQDKLVGNVYLIGLSCVTLSCLNSQGRR